MNIFEEENDEFFGRFSTMVIILFAYYAVSYYGILYFNMKCQNLPSFTVVLLLIVLHIAQVAWLKQCFEGGNTTAAWLLIFVPALVLVLTFRYLDNQKKEQNKRLNLMLYQMQQQQQPGTFNPSAMQQQQMQQHQPAGQTLSPHNIDQLLHTAPGALNNQQMNTLMTSNNVPGYGDYMAQPYDANGLNPYSNLVSPF